MKLRRRQEIPSLNTTATADISFILLIFFLVTTSMDVDKGIMRQLPPKTDQTEQNTAVEKENLLTIAIAADGTVMANDSVVELKTLAANVAEFIQRRGADHLITIDAHPDAAYEPYFLVTDAIVGAYAMERNRLAQQRFKADFNRLDDDRRAMILDICPQRVAENYNDLAEATEGGAP